MDNETRVATAAVASFTTVKKVLLREEFVGSMLIKTAHRGTVPHGLVIVAVGDGLRVDLHVTAAVLPHAHQPGATFSERSWHVVSEQVGASADVRFAEAETTHALTLRTRLAAKNNDRMINFFHGAGGKRAGDSPGGK